jgi:hypothetical protein
MEDAFDDADLSAAADDDDRLGDEQQEEVNNHQDDNNDDDPYAGIADNHLPHDELELRLIKRLTQRIHAHRDEFFNPGLEHLLIITTTDKLTSQVLMEEGIIGYRPKDGDFNNLQRFLTTVDYEDDPPYCESFVCRIIVWLPNNQGFCIVNSINFGFADVEITWDDTTYYAVFAAEAFSCSGVNISIYLARDCPVNCDWVLQTITDMQPANPATFVQVNDYETTDSLFILMGADDPSSNMLVGDCFSSTAWQDCLETLTVKNVPIQLHGSLLLSDEQWIVLQNVEDLMLDSDAPIPASVWRECRALKVIFRNHQRADDDLQALTAIGQRSKPLANVAFDKFALADTIGFNDALLGALGRITSFKLLLNGYHGSLQSWTNLWLSKSFQSNTSLMELDISRGSYENGSVDDRYLEVIRECLQVNWTLQDIKFPEYLLVGNASHYWQANIEPLLELNRSHVPRLEPGWQRLSVLHDALIRVRSHPTKLYKLLLKHPYAFTRIAVRDRLYNLERVHKETLEAKASLHIENILQSDHVEELQRQVREQQREIATMELELLVRRQRDE